MRKYNILFLIAGLSICLSCRKNDSPTVFNYTVPTTYDFTNFNDSGQLKLLSMADQIVAAINLGNNSGTVVSAQMLIDIFNNTGGYFNDSALQLNASGLRLVDYTSTAAQADILNYIDSIGLYSQSITTASPGIAGVSPSVANPSKKYLLSPNGVFFSQLVKKTIMGGICAYEIENVYLTDSVSNSVNNSTIVPGLGTAMEHHWDEAFGLWGVPVNFPANTTGLRYFGSYSNQVDAGLHSNSSIMNAFLKGRAAISNKDLATKQTQANILITTFDSLDAAAIVQEMKETDENIEAGDAIAAYGTLSESLGFVRNLKYNTGPRVITDAQIAQLLTLYDSTNPSSPNLYNFVGANVNTVAQIEAKTNAIRQLIGTIYEFSSTELPLL